MEFFYLNPNYQNGCSDDPYLHLVVYGFKHFIPYVTWKECFSLNSSRNVLVAFGGLLTSRLDRRMRLITHE